MAALLAFGLWVDRAPFKRTMSCGLTPPPGPGQHTATAIVPWCHSQRTGTRPYLPSEQPSPRHSATSSLVKCIPVRGVGF